VLAEVFLVVKSVRGPSCRSLSRGLSGNPGSGPSPPDPPDITRGTAGIGASLRPGVPGGGPDDEAARAERHRVHASAGAGHGLAERAGLRGSGDVPQPDRAVAAASGQNPPARAERQQVFWAGDAGGQGLAERAGVRGIGDVPQPDRAVVAAGGQRPPARAERCRVRVGAGRNRRGQGVFSVFSRRAMTS